MNWDTLELRVPKSWAKVGARQDQEASGGLPGKDKKDREWPAVALESLGGGCHGVCREGLWSGGCWQGLCLATGPVSMVGVLEEVPAGNVGVESGTGQEGPC